MERLSLSREAFLAGLGASAALAATGGVSAAADPRSAAQGIIEAYLRANGAMDHLGIVVGIVAPGAPPSLLFGGSLVSARDHARPVELGPQTPFLIGSITKVFTSHVYAMRQRDYAKTLGECITAGLPPGLSALTIRDIATYGSGLPTDNSPPIWWRGALDVTSLRSLLASLAAHPALPQCAPGTSYSYSNFAWGLMGLASIGVSSPDQPVAAQWIDAIGALANELGLSAQTTPWTANTVNTLAAGYGRHGGLVAQGSNYGGVNWGTLGGGGDLVSTGSDMLRWLEYCMGRTALDRAMLREQQIRTWSFSRRQPASRGIAACQTEPIASPVITSLGGWFHPPMPGNPGRRLVTKNGGVTGYSSWMGFVPWAGSGVPSGLGVFALANGPKAADVVGKRVMRALA